jgi:hypothetical protein
MISQRHAISPPSWSATRSTLKLEIAKASQCEFRSPFPFELTFEESWDGFVKAPQLQLCPAKAQIEG